MRWLRLDSRCSSACSTSSSFARRRAHRRRFQRSDVPRGCRAAARLPRSWWSPCGGGLNLRHGGAGDADRRAIWCCRCARRPALNTLLITLMLGTVLRESVRLFYPEGANPKPFPALLPTRLYQHRKFNLARQRDPPDHRRFGDCRDSSSCSTGPSSGLPFGPWHRMRKLHAPWA